MPLHRPPSNNASSGSHNGEPPELPPFNTCTRNRFSADYTDWYQIISPQHFPYFDICPDCFKASILPTSYARFFAVAAPRPAGSPLRCDFSDLWMQVAWAWLFQRREPDVSLLGRLSEVACSEGHCPNLTSLRSGEDDPGAEGGEKPIALRTWFCLQDPKTGALIDDWTVCGDCVLRLETVAPVLKGMFHVAADGEQVQATCDLMVPGSHRTIAFLDKILDVALGALDGMGTSGPGSGAFHPPNAFSNQRPILDVEPLTTYVKTWALVPPCPGTDPFNEAGGPGPRKIYSIPSVREFTACEECYLTHIPSIASSSPHPPSILLSTLHILASPALPASYCSLSTPRLRQYFTDAVQLNDPNMLREKIAQRARKFEECKARLDALRQTYRMQQIQAKGAYDMALIEQSSAFNTTLCQQMVGNYVITDFSPGSAQMQRGFDLDMQAKMTLSSMQVIEQEWADYWE